MESLVFKTQSERNIGKQRRSRSCGNYLNFGCKPDPPKRGMDSVYKVKICGYIEPDTQRKVESVYEVKGKNNGRGCADQIL